MLNILLIEPDTTYQRAIEKFISKEILFVEFKKIETFRELQNNKLEDFDIVICNYMLPDTKDHEHIEYLLNKNKNIIILTKYKNEKIDEKYIENILDYIDKEDMNVFKYLSQLIKRYNKNRYLKVLVVDDSKVIRKKIIKYLKLFNLNVLEAENGKKAKNMLNSDISLVITDIYMSEIDGFELTKEIRKEKSFEELPILGISSANNSHDAIKLLKCGANDFIKKPFLKEELLVRVENLLNLYDFINKYKQKAEIDPLTGAYNRSVLESKIDTLFHIYEKKSIAMLDIDHFKKINDTYGHQVGDEILKYFAHHIKNVIRKDDFLVRYGGEEFLIFMPNTTKAEAYIVLHKIKNSLNHLNGLKFTFSAGIADEGETLVEMIKIADERLYKAKKNGRNKIVIK